MCTSARSAKTCGSSIVVGCDLFLGGIRAVFGGKQSGYLKMIAQTRYEALALLSDHARSLGANAVLAMRFDYGKFDASQDTKL